jgi:hypothetical protein
MAGVALLLVLFPTSVGAGAPSAGNVSVVHGIGDVDGENPVDVYVRATGSPDGFALIIEGIADDFGYGAIANLGPLPAGDYDVLLCTASSDPLDPIDDCSDNEESAVNGGAGNTVTVPEEEQVVLFAGFGEAGRPEVLVFEPDLTCIETATDGRATANHAADADPVTVTVAGTPIIEGLANGESEALDVPAGPYDATITDGALLDLDVTLTVTALQNTMFYVTGDPDSQDEYTVITQTFAITACPADSTTTTGAVQATTQPRFTG